jgi:hypothetical protein
MSRTVLAIVATTEREKKRLAEIGYRLGRKTFEDVPGTCRLEDWGILECWRYILHDQDAKYARSLRASFIWTHRN